MACFTRSPLPPFLLVPLLLALATPAASYAPPTKPAFASPFPALSLSSCLPLSRPRISASPVSSTTACQASPSSSVSTNPPPEADLNFRDLSDAGGACGPGKLFRTANLMASYKAEGASEELCEGVGIGCVIDLRSKDEMKKDVPMPFAVTHTFRRPAREPPLDAGGAGGAAHRARYIVPMLERGPIFEGMMKRIPPKDKLAMLFWGLFNGDKQQELFIGKMNEGGLLGLSEIIIDECQPEVSYVLRVIATHVEGGVPVAFQCRLGKDRTGIVAALLLLALGASDEQVINDYVKSHGRDQIALGAVEREAERIKTGPRLDRRVFQGAKVETMEGVIAHIREKYGSIEGYLDRIGFDQKWRDDLRRAAKQ
mmetsp:Transcript_13167/g.30596  ORF Transcript_13167/g.30596 Transcript_13167/m.30596 type:complete len:369 (+) Transcript_13167:309-1415(+)